MQNNRTESCESHIHHNTHNTHNTHHTQQVQLCVLKKSGEKKNFWTIRKRDKETKFGIEIL